MTPLRRRMIDDMTLRNFTRATIDAYVRAVARFARYFHRSPDRLGREHVRSYLLHLLNERHVSQSYYKLTRSALRFFYRETLGRDDVPGGLVPVKRPRSLPVGREKDCHRGFGSATAARSFLGLARGEVQGRKTFRLPPSSSSKTRWGKQ